MITPVLLAIFGAQAVRRYPCCSGDVCVELFSTPGDGDAVERTQAQAQVPTAGPSHAAQGITRGTHSIVRIPSMCLHDPS